MWLVIIGLITILILTILILVFATQQTRDPSSSLSSSHPICYHFPLSDFHHSCKDHPLRIENYSGTLKSDPSTRTYITVNDWFDSPSSKEGHMSKLSFKSDSTNPIAQYILRWVATQTPSFPHELQTRLETDPSLHYSLRLTSHSWAYPSHFDCLDNYTIVLAGTRHCILDKKTKVTLNAGDMLYIPAPQEHEFWCDTPPGQLNILLNINFAPRYHREKCDAEFAKLYPFQVERLDQMVDYS
jgi:mannose-6-phosphate isomerase-like protein (cupin superfamily)